MDKISKQDKKQVAEMVYDVVYMAAIRHTLEELVDYYREIKPDTPAWQAWFNVDLLEALQESHQDAIHAMHNDLELVAQNLLKNGLTIDQIHQFIFNYQVKNVS